MSQVINTNIMSLNAQRNLANSSASLSTTIQRLSSGLRINSAKDDAAGLAISERFTTQIRGMNQAARNANDGISLAQTAEGALGEIGNNLQRIRELAVQARNATNSASDRAALNAEVQLLKAEIQRVAEQTNFNGTSLLDGTFQNQAFQIGADQGQVINIAQIANANIESLGNWTAAPTAASMNAVPATANVATASAAGTAVASAATTIPGGSGTSTFSLDELNANFATGTHSIGITVDGVALAPYTLNQNWGNGATWAGAQAQFITDLNTHLNGAATATIDTANNNVVITSASTTTSATDVSSVVLTFNSSNITGTATSNNGAQPSPGPATFGALAAGELSINGIPLTSTGVSGAGANAAGGAAAIVAAFEAAALVPANATALAGITMTQTNGVITLTSANGQDVTVAGTAPEKAGLTAGVFVDAPVATFNAGSFSLVGPSGTATINFAEAGGPTQRASNLVTAINNQSYNTGVTASLVNGNLVLNADKGDFTIGNGLPATATAAEITDANASVLASTGLTVGTTEADAVGSAWVTGAPATGFADLDISTADAADNALLAMDAALTEINSARADLGAIQNRFQSTIASLNTASENLSAARSRIRDTDFAKETAELTRTQILQQAGTAMLAQANQVPQNVLSLLK